MAVVLQSLALYWPQAIEAPPAFDVPHLDKVVHVALFALTTWALLRVLPAWATFALMVVQIGLSEGIQGAFLPGRSADPLDAAADLVGIALGWGLWRRRQGEPRTRTTPATRSSGPR